MSFMNFWRAIIGRPQPALLALALTAVPAAASGQSYSDPTMAPSNWSAQLCPGVPLVTPVSNYSTSLDANAGNPAPSMHIEQTYDARIHVCHLRNNAIADPGSNSITSINFAMAGRIDAITPENTGACIQFRPLIRQNGVYFRGTPFPSACQNNGWMTGNIALSAADFTRSDTDASAQVQQPDFSCTGAPIELGFADLNQTGGARRSRTPWQVVAHADDWSATVRTGEACPSSAGPPNPFMCYDILDHERDLYPMDRGVIDQFGESAVRLGHPVALCNPARFRAEYPDDPVDPENHLVCYEVLDRGRGESQNVVIHNRLDQENAMVIGAMDMLCLPSQKEHR
jgi:hypothetical protein